MFTNNHETLVFNGKTIQFIAYGKNGEKFENTYFHDLIHNGAGVQPYNPAKHNTGK